VGHVEPRLVHLEIVLVLVQDRRTVCTERNIGLQIILNAPDGTPSDVGHAESCFGLFRDSVSISARHVHSLCQVYHRLRNHFRHTGLYSLVTRLELKLVLVRLEIVLILTQDRCKICAKCTIGS
jgi:hypothetical protein